MSTLIDHLTWFKPTDVPGVFDFEIDNSSVENFTTCARAAEYYSIIKREIASDKAALFYGTVVHAALEVRKHAQLAQEFSGFEESQNVVIETAYTTSPQPIDEWRSADSAIRLMQTYNKKYDVSNEPFTIIPNSVETSFRLLLGTCTLDCALPTRHGPVSVQALNIYWTGRIDAIVNYDNSVFVMDHKTSSIGGPQYFEDFRLSSQMHGYVWAARQLGHPAVGLLLDSLISRKPTATGKSVELQRDRYWYLDEAVDEWQTDTFTHVTDFLEHAARNIWPKATKWCHGKYGECPYWSVCTSPKDLRMPLLMSEQYKDVSWSPLAPRDITKTN